MYQQACVMLAPPGFIHHEVAFICRIWAVFSRGFSPPAQSRMSAAQGREQLLSPLTVCSTGADPSLTYCHLCLSWNFPHLKWWRRANHNRRLLPQPSKTSKVLIYMREIMALKTLKNLRQRVFPRTLHRVNQKIGTLFIKCLILLIHWSCLICEIKCFQDSFSYTNKLMVEEPGLSPFWYCLHSFRCHSFFIKMLNTAMTSALGIWKMKTTTVVLASKAWLLSVAYRGFIDKTLPVVHLLYYRR